MMFTLLFIIAIFILILAISSCLGYRIVDTGMRYYSNPDGSFVKLLHDENTIDPTFEQVKAFLETDQTDKLPYIPGKFVCSNFAETLQNNATRAGYRCAWVAINFNDGTPSHSCNAFHTTDRGLIFVDCTNSLHPQPGVRFSTIVDVRPKKIYQPQSIVDNTIQYEPLGEISGYTIFW